MSKFIPSEQRFENYNERDFGGKIRFEEGTSLKLGPGTILFGTSRGVLYFEPEHIKKSNYVPSIILGTLKISNQEVVPDVPGSLLRQSLDNTEHLVLSHKENIVTLSYAVCLHNSILYQIRVNDKHNGYFQDKSYPIVMGFG